MKRWIPLFSVIVCLVCMAQDVLSDPPPQIAEEESIQELYQLFNRTDWRIQKINELVNKHQSDNDFRLISFEVERLVLLVSLAEKNFVPQEKKDVVLPLMDTMRDACAQLSQKAKEQSHDGVKEAANSLFRAYTAFKMSLKDKSVSELQ